MDEVHELVLRELRSRARGVHPVVLRALAARLARESGEPVTAAEVLRFERTSDTE